MLSVSNMPFMLSVIMLSAFMLSVVAPKKGKIGFQSELLGNWLGTVSGWCNNYVRKKVYFSGLSLSFFLSFLS